MLTEEFLKKTAIGIIISCIGTLLLGVIIACIGKFCLNQSQDIQVHYTIQTDRLGHITPDAKMQMDSLIWAVETHEKHVADKYEYIIEQRSNIETYLTFGGIILSVVLAVFGFFGFKSLHDIEERLKNQIEPKVANDAQDKAKEVSENLFNNYKQQSKDILDADKKIVLADIEAYKKSTTSSLTVQTTVEIKKAVANFKRDQKRYIENEISTKYDETIGRKIDDVENNVQAIGELQLEISKLKQQITDLKYGGRQPISQRKNAHASMPIPDQPVEPTNSNEDPDPFNQNK